jgi:hypothetical protein
MSYPRYIPDEISQATLDDYTGLTNHIRGRINWSTTGSISGSSMESPTGSFTNISGSQLSLTGNLYVSGTNSGSTLGENANFTYITGSNISGSNATLDNVISSNITGSSLRVNGSTTITGSCTVQGTLSGSNLYAYHNEFGAYIVVIDGVEFTLGYG